MKSFRNLFLVLFVSLLVAGKSCANSVWINDLKTLYQTKHAIIYGINIRTFNAKDMNGDGIIEEEYGEESGNFINAIDRLDDLAAIGINTVHLLPITPVGKVKALGTAGSLYAPSSFNDVNPQLASKRNPLSPSDQLKQFVAECHARNIRVIVDLPACGSYDLYLRRPELFKKDINQKPLVPADWTDVRLLDAGENNKINMDVYNLYCSFIDMAIDLDIDGIVADVATIKPYSFWKKIIDETRSRNPEFLFIAQASSYSQSSISDIYTPYEKLLEAGFDGYYGGYSNLQKWNSANELISKVKSDVAISKKFAGKKAVIGDFATHDDVSPILVNGSQYSKMIIWLNATLPLNPYYIDGFPTGDTYLYPQANKNAKFSFTDDDTYFVHRGQLDIFNFSRMPGASSADILQELVISNRFREVSKNIITNGNFISLHSTGVNTFAYARSYNNASVVVIGNLNFRKSTKTFVRIPRLTPNTSSVPIKISNIPILMSGKISTDLEPGEIQVIFLDGLELK